MICNKKAYPDMREDCETCSERDACFSGHAVGVALAEIPKLAEGGICNNAMFPNCVDCKDIEIIDVIPITIDTEKLKGCMMQDFYMRAGFGFVFGA